MASCFCLLNFSAKSVSGFQTQKVDAKKLRRLFVQAVGQDFEIVKDEMKNRPRDTVSDYWLVRVKPKRSGHYTLKYTYKFVKSLNNYPEEGENKMYIGVGGKRCYRRNIPQSGIANFCLGDTIIIPIRTVNLSDHAFTFERREQESESLEISQKKFSPYGNYSPVAPIYNQLETNIRLLGMQRMDLPHRNCCPVTYEYYAVLQALKPGRFNLGLSSFRNNETPDASIKMNAKSGTPIIIVNPETPITGLVSGENEIHYGDNKRFSAHAGNSFPTNLLILQPGDIFVLKYSGLTIDYGFGSKSKREAIPDIKPAIYKIPFAIDKDWSFNDWLADYLPKEN